MSVLKFELKNEHLKLLKHLRWSMNGNNLIVNLEDDESTIFGENNIYDAIDLILNGRPAEIDALTHEDIIEYTPEQKAEWDKIYSELPMALDVVLYNGHFELGEYKTRYHLRDWKKIN